MHMLPEQVRPLAQALLQLPQFALSVLVLISQPFGPPFGLAPSQFAWVPSQCGVQVPERHSLPIEFVPVGTQARLQAPQSPMSVRRFDSQALGSVSQSPQFARH
jgi:hypothetical protein